jgi:hypothetical protein
VDTNILEERIYPEGGGNITQRHKPEVDNRHFHYENVKSKILKINECTNLQNVVQACRTVEIIQGLSFIAANFLLSVIYIIWLLFYCNTSESLHIIL